MMNIPVLETARLRLREHRTEDFAGANTIWGDPNVVRFIGGKPSTEQQCWSRLMTYRGHWVLMGFGYWAVEEKSTGRYIGDIGMADFRRDITPSLRGLPELGWVLATDTHGKGYATEAVTAVIAWGDKNLPAMVSIDGLIEASKPLNERRMVAIIDVAHAGSIRVAEKSGFKKCGETTFMSEPVFIFERRF